MAPFTSPTRIGQHCEFRQRRDQNDRAREHWKFLQRGHSVDGIGPASPGPGDVSPENDGSPKL